MLAPSSSFASLPGCPSLILVTGLSQVFRFSLSWFYLQLFRLVVFIFINGYQQAGRVWRGREADADSLNTVQSPVFSLFPKPQALHTCTDPRIQQPVRPHNLYCLPQSRHLPGSSCSPTDSRGPPKSHGFHILHGPLLPHLWKQAAVFSWGTLFRPCTGEHPLLSLCASSSTSSDLPIHLGWDAQCKTCEGINPAIVFKYVMIYDSEQTLR